MDKGRALGPLCMLGPILDDPERERSGSREEDSGGLGPWKPNMSHSAGVVEVSHTAQRSKKNKA